MTVAERFVQIVKRMWFSLSIAGRCVLTVLLLIAGSYAVRRPSRKIEGVHNWPWSLTLGIEHGIAVVLSTMVLITLVWLL